MLRHVLLALALLLPGGASATVLLDNSGSALVFAEDLRSTNRGGISFTVGSTGYVLNSIQFVPVKANGSGDALGDITIGLYPWDPSTNTISGSAVVSETFTGLLFKDLGSASWSDKETVTFTSAASLNPNASYIIVFGPTSITGVVSGIATAAAPVSTGSSGLTLLYGDGISTDSGATWVTSGNLLVSISGTATNSVPTLSEWTQILLAILVMSALVWYFRNQQGY